MKYETPKYKPSTPSKSHPALRFFDWAAGLVIAVFVILAALFLAFSAQGCGPSSHGQHNNYVFQLAYQPYKVYVSNTWDTQERNCIAAAVYAHLDVWVTFRGGISITPPKQGLIFVHGKKEKFLNATKTFYYDGGDEIHVTATSHKLPGLIECIERHQNPENIVETWVPTSASTGYNPGLSYNPTPLTLAWHNLFTNLEGYSSQIADLYQIGVPCKYDGR